MVRVCTRDRRRSTPTVYATALYATTLYATTLYATALYATTAQSRLSGAHVHRSAWIASPRSGVRG
ncbi:MAG: hypothetical protein KA129_10175, partial [Microthrixaceae bacterium]|nr:hypothetical protein [Microthrixaceae bacterium]